MPTLPLPRLGSVRTEAPLRIPQYHTDPEFRIPQYHTDPAWKIASNGLARPNSICCVNVVLCLQLCCHDECTGIGRDAALLETEWGLSCCSTVELSALAQGVGAVQGGWPHQTRSDQTACCLLPAVHCSLPAVHCLLPAAHCSLPAACCSLPALLLAARCHLKSISAYS